MILPYIKTWKTPLLFRTLWPVFIQAPVWRRYFVSSNIIHYVPKQHNPTLYMLQMWSKAQWNLFSVGLDQALEAPGYHEWSSSFLYSLLGIRLVLSMGFVGIKFIVPNLRLIPCFDGLCSSASHYPWTVFDTRTEGGRHFFHSLLWNTEHLVIFRIYYTHIPLL